jgi:hypothetical protein
VICAEPRSDWLSSFSHRVFRSRSVSFMEFAASEFDHRQGERRIKQGRLGSL